MRRHPPRRAVYELSDSERKTKKRAQQLCSVFAIVSSSIVCLCVLMLLQGIRSMVSGLGAHGNATVRQRLPAQPRPWGGLAWSAKRNVSEVCELLTSHPFDTKQWCHSYLHEHPYARAAATAQPAAASARRRLTAGVCVRACARTCVRVPRAYAQSAGRPTC